MPCHLFECNFNSLSDFAEFIGDCRLLKYLLAYSMNFYSIESFLVIHLIPLFVQGYSAVVFMFFSKGYTAS